MAQGACSSHSLCFTVVVGWLAYFRLAGLMTLHSYCLARSEILDLALLVDVLSVLLIWRKNSTPLLYCVVVLMIAPYVLFGETA